MFKKEFHTIHLATWKFDLYHNNPTSISNYVPSVYNPIPKMLSTAKSSLATVALVNWFQRRNRLEQIVLTPGERLRWLSRRVFRFDFRSAESLVSTVGELRPGCRFNPFRLTSWIGVLRGASSTALLTLFPSAESRDEFMYRRNRCCSQRVNYPGPMSSMQ